MIFSEWKHLDTVYTFAEAEANKRDLQHVFDMYSYFENVHVFPDGGFFVELEPGQYHCIAGINETESDDVEKMREFLWFEHSLYNN